MLAKIQMILLAVQTTLSVDQPFQSKELFSVLKHCFENNCLEKSETLGITSVMNVTNPHRHIFFLILREYLTYL